MSNGHEGLYRERITLKGLRQAGARTRQLEAYRHKGHNIQPATERARKLTRWFRKRAQRAQHRLVKAAMRATGLRS